ncbi:hypothetical protein PANT111_20034 [Pantoea brenneri]|uniref:Uncharacterized protein n=1 Tax=Pantoea brenneri TaxID=472694 RepID=A0AAX3J8H3_9GAMM|nr:hypothetical protein PANT111_20034 [Pantoea brenneri]
MNLKTIVNPSSPADISAEGTFSGARIAPLPAFYYRVILLPRHAASDEPAEKRILCSAACRATAG